MIDTATARPASPSEPASGRPGAPEIARQQGVNPVDYLRSRGFIADITDEVGLRAAFANGPVSAYIGFDPTGPSLHAGHMVGIMLLATLQRMGHRPIALGGGGTAMVGDPTGRTSARELIGLDDLDRNLAGISAQLARYLDFEGNRFADGNPPAELLNNADWLLKLHYIPFLRDIGRHFSVNEMLAAETYKTRLESTGLNFVEFNYRLVQAYDFLHLFRTEGCVLQMGGSDQWGNIVAGVDLIRRAEGGKAFAFVSPLVTTASGEKMGKTGSGVRVWLDPERFSPYDYYQFWVNTGDALVGDYLRKFTFLPNEEIDEMTSVGGEALREAKQVLAFEATSLAHGPNAAVDALMGSSRFLTFIGTRIRETSPEQVKDTADALEQLAENAEVFASDEKSSLSTPTLSSSELEPSGFLPDPAIMKALEAIAGVTQHQSKILRETLLPSVAQFVTSPQFRDSKRQMEEGMALTMRSLLSSDVFRTLAQQNREFERTVATIREAGPYWTSAIDVLQVPFIAEHVTDISELFPNLDTESEDFRMIQQSVRNHLAHGLPLERAIPTLHIQESDLDSDMTVADAFVRAELAKSRGEARRLASQGGLSIDDRKLSDVDVPLRDALGDARAIMLRAGKKRFMRVVVGDRS